jgi:mannose/fructose-specific phosphotransferase system component IIA
MKACLLLSHGNIAQALLDASRKIVGECQNIYALDCDNIATDLVYENIAHLIKNENLIDGLFILVCLRGGTGWNVAARIARDFPNVLVMSGMNLSILLSFITKHSKFGFEELATILLEDGKRGISQLSQPAPR